MFPCILCAAALWHVRSHRTECATLATQSLQGTRFYAVHAITVGSLKVTRFPRQSLC